MDILQIKMSLLTPSSLFEYLHLDFKIIEQIVYFTLHLKANTFKNVLLGYKKSLTSNQ